MTVGLVGMLIFIGFFVLLTAFVLAQLWVTFGIFGIIPFVLLAVSVTIGGRTYELPIPHNVKLFSLLTLIAVAVVVNLIKG
nr:MAG TPA: hypothetical protein [Caudoviricetes sp.]